MNFPIQAPHDLISMCTSSNKFALRPTSICTIIIHEIVFGSAGAFLINHLMFFYFKMLFRVEDKTACDFGRTFSSSHNLLVDYYFLTWFRLSGLIRL